jgi:hypothetical protein
MRYLRSSVAVIERELARHREPRDGDVPPRGTDHMVVLPLRKRR